ncbi:hypothetical protein DUNSADRAFT_12730 [Dunaliella salina]|uniref:Encoded protein n=1 Tax=Dunaliella salina TaxID=3046 RepID=A0ABQ7GAP9_DUNSA|nr:hypothetical protein DUNSADRAFT_12730 [Dunaliella salina]|eukprot:KAF5831676.1 hypothetical protein DUNSADRAFT_12730 [Dunaliella salina]
MRPVLISLPILISLFEYVRASSFSRQEQAVEVVFPSGTSGKMDMAMADFGRPKYGGFLV